MPIKQQTPGPAEAAEMLAVQALAFIAGDPDRLGRFLAITGIGPAEIRIAAREPHFLAGVLDHIASDEALLMLFAEQSGLEPKTIAHARRVLGYSAGESENL